MTSEEAGENPQMPWRQPAEAPRTFLSATGLPLPLHIAPSNHNSREKWRPHVAIGIVLHVGDANAEKLSVMGLYPNAPHVKRQM
jgi:hypothetical protein